MDKDKLKLIACVKPHPKLYVPDDPNVKPTKADKAEKERLWRHIAKQCGFKITTEAKLKWRLLINYFIQHLNNVAHKKIRRYVPRTGNSKDQFVQPHDWKYYHAMKFMRPYVKLCQCSECINNKQGEVLSSGGVSRPDANSVGGGVTGTSASASAAALNAEQVIKLNVGNMILNIKVQPPNKPPPESVSTHSPRTVLITNENNIAAPSISYNEVLSELDENDENLKRFFDVMLHSTMKLPIYHQDRVKKRLMEIIDKENANVP